MRRLVLAALTLATIGPAATAIGVGPAAAATVAPHTLAVGRTLTTGQQLRSTDGRYTATVQTNGDLYLRGPKGYVWHTNTKGTKAYLRMQTDGNLVLYASGHAVWAATTVGSGAHDTLSLATNGVLAVTNPAGTVWADNTGNGCGTNRAARFVRVSLGRQLAWMCQGRELVHTTAVTSGASAKGDGTPTGTWHIYAKVRDTHLYPAGGGVYYVHYWMPYSGPYGFHDSPWQTFPYGSSLYRTQGSHGCVHLPGPTAAWFYGWAPVGTTVTIQH